MVDGLVAALVHREAQAIPVTGGAELFELLDNPAAVLILPRPGALQELFAADFFLCDALLRMASTIFASVAMEAWSVPGSHRAE